MAAPPDEPRFPGAGAGEGASGPSPSPSPAASIEDYVAGLRARFAASAAGGGELGLVMALADELPPFDPALRTQETRFHGCQSRIWLVLDADPLTSRIRIATDSDARLMRGLLAVAVGLYGGRTPGEIASYPPSRLLGGGLLEALAPSRANGFARLLGRIHDFAVRGRMKETRP